MRLALLASCFLMLSGDFAYSQTTPRTIVREESEPARWSLLIGVNDYMHVNDLQYCADDVEGLKERLEENGFDKRQQFLLRTGASDTSAWPLKSNVEKHLSFLLGTLAPDGKQLASPGLVGEDDLVVIAFSGHGVNIDGKSFLCPVEADLGQPSSLISLDKVYDWLDACPAQFKLLLVDACRNDPTPGGEKAMRATTATKDFARSLEKPPKGILVLSSCASGQVSLEDETLGHGVFMHFLLEGLTGKADNEKGDRNGRVSLLELYKYAGDKTKFHVADTRRMPQTPALRGEIVGDFEFGFNDDAEIDRYVERLKQLRESKELSKALIEANKAIRLYPKSADLYEARSVLWYSMEMFDEGLSDIDKAIDLDPENHVFYNERGLHYFKNGEYKTAIRSFDRAINLRPEYAPAYCNRGDSFRELRDFDRASTDYNLAIQLDPDDARIHNNLSYLYFKKGEYESAISGFNRAIEADAEYALAYYNRGDVYQALDDHDRALADYNIAIQLDPNESRFYNNRGLSWYDKDENDKAITDFTKAIELDLNSPTAYLNRGLAYKGAERYQDAINDFNKAVRLDSSYVDTVARSRGGTYYMLDQYDLAIKDLSRHLELNPEMDYSYYLRGRCWAEKGNSTNAIKDYSKCIELNPTYAKAYMYRAKAYLKLKNLQKAESDISQYERYKK